MVHKEFEGKIMDGVMLGGSLSVKSIASEGWVITGELAREASLMEAK